MSSGMTEVDSAAYAGQPAWHRMGITLPEVFSPATALQAAKLDWTVEPVPVFARASSGPLDGLTVECPGTFAQVRSDTREVLGVVGAQFRAVQNHELAALVEGVVETLCGSGALSRGAGRVVECAGSLRRGRTVYFLVRVGSFEVAPGDTSHEFLLLRTAHDGSASLILLPTSVRVVCANTESLALRLGKGQGWRLRHTGTVLARAEDALEAWAGVQEMRREVHAQNVAMASRVLDKSARRAYFLDVYDALVGLPKPNPRTRGEKTAHTRAVQTLAEWEALLSNPRNAVPSTAGTLYGALQSVTYWADHSRTVRVTDGAEDERDARTFSNLFGTSADAKAKAAAVALAVL